MQAHSFHWILYNEGEKIQIIKIQMLSKEMTESVCDVEESAPLNRLSKMWIILNSDVAINWSLKPCIGSLVFLLIHQSKISPPMVTMDDLHTPILHFPFCAAKDSYILSCYI